MPRGPKGEKRPANPFEAAIMVDLAEMVDASLPKPGKRRPYKKLAA